MLFYGNILGTHTESLPYFCRRQARIHSTGLLFMRARTWKCVLQSVLWSRCKGWIWLCFQRAHSEVWAQLSGMRNLGHRWRLFIKLRLFLCEFSSCGMGWVTVKQCGKAKLVPLFSSTGVSLCPPPFLLQRMKLRPSLSWLWVANSWANTRLPPYSSQTQVFCYRARGGNQGMVDT